MHPSRTLSCSPVERCSRRNCANACEPRKSLHTRTGIDPIEPERDILTRTTKEFLCHLFRACVTGFPGTGPTDKKPTRVDIPSVPESEIRGSRKAGNTWHVRRIRLRGERKFRNAYRRTQHGPPAEKTAGFNGLTRTARGWNGIFFFFCCNFLNGSFQFSFRGRGRGGGKGRRTGPDRFAQFADIRGY